MRALSLASHLVTLGHEVTLVASRSTPGFHMRRSMIDGVAQIEMPDVMPRRMRHGGLSPLDVLLRSFWILFARYDLIHGFDHRPAVTLPAFLGKKVRGMTYVADWADLWGKEGIAAQRSSLLGKLLGKFDDEVENRIHRWAAGVTAISTDLDRRLEEQGVPESKRMILPPGANLNLIRPVEKIQARDELRLPRDAHIVAFSGYAPYDQEFLIQAVSAFLRKDREIIVISSGVVIPHLSKLTKELGQGERILQFGTLPLDKMGALLGAADLLMLPYLNTPVNRGRFPNKFGDYMAAGRPVITHRTGDLAELVEREDLGILSSEDPETFVEDGVRLLDSPSDCERMGVNARRFAERQWNWDLQAQQVNDFYIRIRS